MLLMLNMEEKKENKTPNPATSRSRSVTALVRWQVEHGKFQDFLELSLGKKS